MFDIIRHIYGFFLYDDKISSAMHSREVKGGYFVKYDKTLVCLKHNYFKIV